MLATIFRTLIGAFAAHFNPLVPHYTADKIRLGGAGPDVPGMTFLSTDH